jgi:hypothetical protein
MARLSCIFPIVLVAACGAEKHQEKGDVDTAFPPESPLSSNGPGKADGLGQSIAINVESEHPYANDLNEEFTIELDDILPTCASSVRLHFASFQLEDGYDFIRIVDAFGNIVESGTGDHSDEYSEWLNVGETARSVSLVLETDYSITRHGFSIDSVDWVGSPICPLFVPSCPAGSVDTNPAPGHCECPQVPTCVALDDIEASHGSSGGFVAATSGNRNEGLTAIAYATNAIAGDTERVLGTINSDALMAWVRDAARASFLSGPSVSAPSNFSETFSVSAGDKSASYVRAFGQFPTDQAELIARYDALYVCGQNEPLTCADNQDCVEGACVPAAACNCNKMFAPVCGNNNLTYGNECMAGCAGTTVKHTGSCGIVGDVCGGKMGLLCQPEHKCRYGVSEFEPPFPDASGLCEQNNYCDAPADCSGLIHIAVPGTWACAANSCNWEVGSPWISLEWSMETHHPYENNESVWRQLYAPAEAGSVRIEIQGTFSLEDGYDLLEIWSWNGGSWYKDLVLTANEASGNTYEVGGRYHYVHFVSDGSVTDHGFTLGASYSMDEI